MGIRYKFNVLEALKAKGYHTGRLRREKLLAEGVMQSLREGKAISFVNLERICAMLELQPGDIIEYVVGDQETP